MSLALALIGAGALGAMIAAALASCVVDLPSGGGGSGGNPEHATRVLRLVPSLVAAGGVGMLGWLTGATPAQRRWPPAVAIVLGATMVCSFDLSAALLYIVGQGRQPYVWSVWSGWMYAAAGGLTAFAGAIGLRRTARLLGSDLLARCASLLEAGALALVVISMAWWWHEMRDVLRHSAPPGTFRRLPYQYFYSALESLQFVTAKLDWLVWMSLALMAIVGRSMWRAKDPGR